jgi:hypothetical protein
MGNVVTSQIALLILVMCKTNVLTQSVRQITAAAAIMFAISMGMGLKLIFLMLAFSLKKSLVLLGACVPLKDLLAQ